MVEYLETVLESSDSKAGKMERDDEEHIPVVPCANDRKKHLSQDSAGKTVFPNYRVYQEFRLNLDKQSVIIILSHF